MTVESQVSKTQKMVMGATNTYDFFFHCLTKDPTEEAAKQAIKVSISDGVNKTELTYGTDYAVKLNDDGTGGTVTVADKKTSAYSLIVYREYDYRQSSDYQNYNAFPADTLEHNLDKATMLCQQLQEQANRAVTVDVFSDTDPAELIDKVETLYADKDNLDLLANNMSSIKTDAENIGVIKTAANNIGAVQTASGSIEAVKTVSDAVNDVVMCAAEIAAIKDAPNKASAAAGSAATAQDWAVKMDGKIGGVDYSSKFYADLAKKWSISSTIVEDGMYGASYYALQAYNANVSAQNAKTLAQDWANKTGAVVADSEYSAKEYAVGTTVATGSAKDWASKTDGPVEGEEYSAKWYALSADASGKANKDLDNLTATGQAVLDKIVPVGTILPYGGKIAPPGYLLISGGAISRTTYADLFAVIGTTYGKGDGSTTFNLPNMSNLYLLNGLNVNTPAQNCRGTGLTMGFLTGNPSYPTVGMRAGDGGVSSAMVGSTGIYGKPIGSAPSGTGLAAGMSVGLTTDAKYSGVMRDAVTSSISNYQIARAIIKY